jgi:hypothetical protein
MLFIDRLVSLLCLFATSSLLINMSVACEAGCGRHFQRQSSMICHLSAAQSCQWYLSKKFRTWDEEEDNAFTFPPAEEDYGGIFDTDDDTPHTDELTNLHSVISQLNLGPRDTVFIPHITANLDTADAGPEPANAANRLRQAALSNHTLDDENDERITITHKNAGVVRRKELPPGHNVQDQDGDTAMDGPNDSIPQPFHPFNSDLDWRVAQWAIKDGPGQNAFDRLLSVPGVCFVKMIFCDITQYAVAGCGKAWALLPQCPRTA